jgi:3-dehydroquinate synthase class II
MLILSQATVKSIKQHGLSDRITKDIQARLDDCIRILAGSSGENLFRAQGEYAVYKRIIEEIKD